MEEALKKFGLTEKETKVYLTCLELGLTTASKISEKANIPRTLTYDILQRLIELGLVSYLIKANKKHFRAADPQKLISILKEKEEAVKRVMAELISLQEKKVGEKTIVEIYEGKEGIKTIFDDILKTKKEDLVFGVTGKADRVLMYYLPSFRKKLKEIKIPVKMLCDYEAKKSEAVKELSFAKIKYMPKDYKSPFAINIYDNKVAMLIFFNEPLGILIENSKIANGFRNYFNLLWKIAKK